MNISEPTILCPSCKTEIKLTESLAAPLIESTRKEFQQQLAQKNSEIAKKEESLLEREQALAKSRETLNAQFAERLRQERPKIAEEESKKARLFLANDIQQKDALLAEQQQIIQQRDAKLADAQKAQADVLRKQRELDDAKREVDVTVEKRIQESLGSIREKAKKEIEDQLNLKMKEKDEMMSGMQKTIEELKRKSDQGSQQLQGEVLELELESLLRAKFPFDKIEPVPKGEHGGDILQRVINQLGQFCGTILWEIKRTKNWSDTWLPKLREDQRTAKAEIAVIVSQVLPKDVDGFETVEGVWTAHPRVSLPVATILRQSLIEVASARQASEGQQTKMEMVYQYLTGPRFRLRVQAIVESFSSMREDLDRERKVITKQWAKREEQIERVMQGTVGMYGDLQGIAGRSLQEIDGLEISSINTIEGPKTQ